MLSSKKAFSIFLRLLLFAVLQHSHLLMAHESVRECVYMIVTGHFDCTCSIFFCKQVSIKRDTKKVNKDFFCVSEKYP